MEPDQTVNLISECFIKPRRAVTGDSSRVFLSPWDLAMLSACYIQKGLLFIRPPDLNMPNYLDSLKESLSSTLDHFYPLAGRLSTEKEDEPRSYVVFIDCNKGPGAKFIHAKLDMTVSDILSPMDLPAAIVQFLFDHDRAVNHDGHERSLLSVQVTELIDGIFIGCSVNHTVADGTSYWHFLNMWSEIFQSPGKTSISRPPNHSRWFPDGHGRLINLPFSYSDQFISRFEVPELRERMIHFSSESIAKMKAKANADCNTTKISSFQALSALMWRTITRARGFPHDREVSCRLSISNRPRLIPPLSENLFGNSIHTVRGVTTAGELLEHDLGWAAWKLHKAVMEHSDQSVRSFLDQWFKSPFVYQFHQLLDPGTVMIGSSPRFDMYANQFGLGKAVAVRSGNSHKFDGKVSAFPGYEGGGSVDLEICLAPTFMNALERDPEFLDAISSKQIIL